MVVNSRLPHGDPVDQLVRDGVRSTPPSSRRVEIMQRAATIRRRRHATLAGIAVALTAVALLVPAIVVKGDASEEQVASGSSLADREVGGETLSTTVLSANAARIDWGELSALVSRTQTPLPPRSDFWTPGDDRVRVTGAVLTDVPGQGVRSGQDELQNTEVVVFVALHVDPDIVEVRLTNERGETQDRVTTTGGLAVLVARRAGIPLDGYYTVEAVDGNGEGVASFPIDPIPQRPLVCARDTESATTVPPSGPPEPPAEPSERARAVPAPLNAPCR